MRGQPARAFSASVQRLPSILRRKMGIARVQKMGKLQIKTEIQKGRNVVELSFKPCSIFPTLEILNFKPKNALVGDVLSFYFDGRKQSYKVELWDESINNYIISSKEDKNVHRTTLASLPLMSNIIIDHKNDTPVDLIVSGIAAGGYVKTLKH